MEFLYATGLLYCVIMVGKCYSEIGYIRKTLDAIEMDAKDAVQRVGFVDDHVGDLHNHLQRVLPDPKLKDWYDGLDRP